MAAHGFQFFFIFYFCFMIFSLFFYFQFFSTGEFSFPVRDHIYNSTRYHFFTNLTRNQIRNSKLAQSNPNRLRDHFLSSSCVGHGMEFDFLHFSIYCVGSTLFFPNCQCTFLFIEASLILHGRECDSYHANIFP